MLVVMADRCVLWRRCNPVEYVDLHVGLQELLDWREKYKNQARELKETLNKLKVTTEQYNEANDGLVA